MEIIKVDQLSMAARAGALDGSLAYASIYAQHRDLIAQSALSGLRGLEQILSETGVYGDAVRTLKEAASKIPEANELALRDPFRPASGSLQSQHNGAALNGLREQGRGYMSTAQGIQDAANAAASLAILEPEKGYASSAQWAANELAALGTGYLVNQGDPSASRHHATVARDSALDTRDKAQDLMNQILRMNPVPWDRHHAASQVWSAADQVVAHSNKVLEFVNTNPIAQIRSHPPTTHDLGGGYSLSTWGSSGCWTLTDAGGAGILVRPNGMVDSLRGDPGWQFATTSTFILPNLTKITVNPGSPADLLISRGVHAFTISHLSSGAWPGAGTYTDLNGREVDLATNDGHILEMGGSAAVWTSGNNALGDMGSREVIGREALINEARRDPTDVGISADMQAFITQMGLTGYDYDNDGKLNNMELMEVASQVDSYIRMIQDAYEQALTRLAQANQALNDLNGLLERLQDENDRSTESRQNDAANARSDLQALERKLTTTLQMLQGTTPTAPLQGDIETSATQVLAQLNSISQNGGITQTTPVAPESSGPSQGTTTVQTTGQSSSNSNGSGAGSDPIGDGLRRAGRLLSGILGGGNLNFLEQPEKPAGTSQTSTTTTTPTTTPEQPSVGGTPPSTEGSQTPELAQETGTQTGAATSSNTDTDKISVTPNSTTPTSPQTAAPLGMLLSQLTAQTPPQDGLPPTQVSPQNLAMGLEALLVTLTHLGLFQPAPQTEVSGTNHLLQTLTSLLGPPPTVPRQHQPGTPSSPTTTTTPQPPPTPTTEETARPQAQAPALFSFLQVLGQLGESLPGTGPQQPPLPSTTTQPGASPTPTPTPTSTPPPLPPSVQQLLTLLTGQSAAALPELSMASEQVAALLAGTAQLGSAAVQQGSGSGSPTREPAGLAELSRVEEQLLLVLQGMAALGSAGAGQSTSTSGTQAPTTMDLRLGLQAFLTALSGLGILGTGSPRQQQTSASGGGAVFQSGSSSSSTHAVSTITGNFQTDPELLKIIEENLSKALQTQQRQLSQAGQLFTQSQEIVQKFVTLIQQDDLVRDVVKSDDLSDEQQALFDHRMTELRKDWGVEWGSSASHTPANQSQLVSKAMQSGMMV